MSQVLFVDDDADLRLLFCSALSACGLDVLESTTAAEACELLKARPFDLLIIGDRLPDNASLSLIKQCRSGGLAPSIVLHTARDYDECDRETLTAELGIAGVVRKAVGPLIFAKHMLHLLESRNSHTRLLSEQCRESARVRVAQLEKSFCEKLPSKLDELSVALELAKHQPEALSHVRTLAHRLRGTLGSYGFQDVGDFVGGLEDALVGLAERGERSDFLWQSAERNLRDAVCCAKRGPDSVATPASRTAKSYRRALLVVDDDIEFLSLVRRYARRHSLSVITAQTVEEGLERSRSAILCAALLDVHLAKVSSIDMVDLIRMVPGNEDLPIIFASADGSLATRLAAAAKGATRFLDKPLSEQRFSDLLLQVPFSETQAARIVILDDDEIVVERYESELRAAGYYVRGISSPDELLTTLEDVRPDALIMDVNLDRISGIDICRALRCSERWQFLPILMFSGDKDSEMRVRAYQAGASDVLGKPLSVSELMTRVTTQVERIQSMRERSDRDSLSGLMLRRAMVEALQRAIAIASREKKEVAVILIDLDHFKNINDQYGHLVGDRVIAAFGRLLLSRYRLEDLRARWGGEEFVVAFPGQGKEFARLATEKLLAEFSQIEFDTDQGGTFRVTFTAGVAVFPCDGESLDLLIKGADDRLYDGKEQGRARVCGPE